MKQIIQLTGLFFFSTICAIAQYTASNEKSSRTDKIDQLPLIRSENPVAIRYLLQHEGLKGKVKKITLKDSTGKVISQEGYDIRGRLTKKLVGSERSAVFDNFSYDSTTRSILQKTEYATGEKVFYKYVYNSNGDVTNYYIANQAGTIFYSKRVYHYQDNLFVLDSAYNPSAFDYYIIHQYNNEGQIISSKTYTQKARVLLAEIAYEYKIQDGLPLIKIQTRTDYSGNGRFENSTSIKYFDNKQHIIKEQNIGATNFSVRPRELTYKLDAAGNWISNSKRETREIEYYEPLPVTNKETAKTDNKNNSQLSLILDENFDNNNNKWAVWDNEGSAAQLHKGNYRVTVKQSNNYASWLSVPGLASDQSKDFAIETKILLNSTETGNPLDSYWLLWGIGDNGKNFYAFGIYPEGKFQYGKLVNSQWDGKAGTIASTSINAGINKANVLRVEKRKDTISFFVNGSKVHKAKYEIFNSSHTGIGFQWNNKKLVDIDYLKIFQGSVSAITLSPEPQESNYQKALAKAGNSKERADAIIDYYLALKALNFSADKLEILLGQKFLQMIDIDFHGYYQVLMSRRINFDDVKLCMKASAVLTAEQRNAVGLLNKYAVDEFQATQNNTAKPAYPTGVPQPGYGWGKTISSNKVNNSNGGNKTPPTIVSPAKPKDELAILRGSAKYLQGQMVYLGSQKTCYFTPGTIVINSVNDEITLKTIFAKFSYSYSSGRNEFGISSSTYETTNIKVKDLVRMIDGVSGAYIVTQIGPCKSCGGNPKSWNNNTRKGSYCTHCGATGCAPIAIWNHGSSRAF